MALLLAVLTAAPLDAQRADSGTVIVTVREAMGMVEGFLVRSETRSATTDASGRAQLILPAGRRSLALTRIGFVPKRVSVVVINSRPIYSPLMEPALLRALETRFPHETEVDWFRVRWRDRD